MLQFFDTLTDDSGNALLGATVAVTAFPAGGAVSIYSSNGTAAPIANSTVIADITGQISFYAPDGAYILTYSYKGTQYKIRSPVQILDPISFVQVGDVGAVNAYVLTSQLLPAQLYAGLKVEMKAANTNTGAATLVLNGSAANPIRQPGGTALAAGMIQQNGLVRFEWDGTQWQLIGSQSQPFYGQTAAEQALLIIPTNTSYPPYTIFRYYSGSGDATSALQTACNAAAQAGYNTVTPGIGGANLAIASAWTCDTNKVGVDFQGAQITTTGFSGVGWFTPFNSSTDANARPGLNRAHPICNAVIYGPGLANTSAVALWLIDTNIISSFPDIAGMSFRDLAFLNWSADVRFGSGAFCIDFTRCIFGNDGGSSAAVYSIANQAAFVNAGERNTFAQCFWYQKGLIVETDTSGEIFLDNCSLDAFNRACFANGSGIIILHKCHIEATADTDYWLYATGTNGKIVMTDCDFALDAAKATFPVFYSDATCTWGGIYGRGLSFSIPNAYTAGALCGGTGNTNLQDYIGLGTGGTTPGYVSAAQNVMADPIFASGALTADSWTASTGGSGATAPLVVASNPFSGSNSVQFAGAVGGFSNLNSRIIACRPGQTAICQLEVMLPTFVAGASFTGKLSYVNAAGAPITSVVGGGTSAGFQFMNITSTQSAYGAQSSAPLGRAPPGTVGVQLAISLGAGGSTIGYLGQVILSVI